MTALPELKTLDNLSDAHLKSQLEKLKNGTTTQEAVVALSSRPMTQSGHRPGTSSGRRPGSSNGERPLTPSSRPGTADRAAPIFHQPSSRAGSTMQLLPAHELEKVHTDVAERLTKIKAMLQRMSGDSPSLSSSPNQSPVNGPSEENTRPARMDVITKNGSEIKDQHIPIGFKVPSTVPGQAPTRQTKKKLGVDAGTDPLESLIGNQFQVELTPRTSRSVDTTTLPPAPPLSVSASTETLTTLNKYSVLGEPQQTSSESLEQEMKAQLIKYATEPETESFDGENQNGRDDPSMESPRISYKSAQRRPPPLHNQRSANGYRTFRLPLRLTANTVEKVNVEAPQAV